MTDVLALDPLKVAAQIGHGAATNAALALRSLWKASDATPEPLWWSNLGAPKVGLDPFDVADDLARTFCRLPPKGDKGQPTITGERAFREAAELRLHGLRGDHWPHLSLVAQLAYTVFAKATYEAWLLITAAQATAREVAAAAERARRPVRRTVPALAETIFDEDRETPATIDPVAAAALKGMRAGNKRERGPVDEAAGAASAPPPAPVRTRLNPARPMGGFVDPRHPPAAKEKLSIGERPLDPAKQVKGKHGGRRTKGQGA